ncbi:hypothetical protein, partial [Novosphingobium sp. 18052]|uniref:hypothetical protein n=1 Tax=Novosphingobium sp. 18052 TaxID=2681400 RepID=UPI001F1751A5
CPHPAGDTDRRPVTLGSAVQDGITGRGCHRFMLVIWFAAGFIIIGASIALLICRLDATKTR